MKPKDIMEPFQATIHPDSTLDTAIKAMSKCRLNILPVTDAGGRLLGIFTRSMLLNLVRERKPLDTEIKPHFYRQVVTVPEDEFYDVEKLFGEFLGTKRNTNFGKISTVIVTDKSGEYLSGVVTKEGLIQYLMGESFKLKKRLEAALEATQEELRRVKLKQHSKYSFRELLDSTPSVSRMVTMAQKAARQSSTILIQGESGTGKEWFAHALHKASQRAGGPFITVNCAAIPEHLLESEFFGYDEGAFTGASKKGKFGKLDMAHGGTLFLDEIGDMSPSLQSKILRVLQEKEFYRVGGTEKVFVDVRVIAATNQPLETLVAQKKFREDLFYRLNVVNFTMPPLRDRREDIPSLIDYFIKELNQTLNTGVTGISDDALGILMGYRLPGNIRELRNIMERAMIFAESGKITQTDLPDKLQSVPNRGPGAVVNMMAVVERKEREIIIEALENAEGNKSRAAKLLGMSRSTLYEKIRKFDISC
ncbi:sigma 54-interacting transcriptional regulator [Metallumcola ferriviriculae]|uniref:Sigma 54-interacting transcriptional regulator n=1 Tax=Metallumcola ferriviriculae TaxID=3039180 RepID=A0AAU0UP97_9FIRM|nr:sigma 54-interacting transcriptional regulator [Desulfitibacteraceae bacterium MK1]